MGNIIALDRCIRPLKDSNAETCLIDRQNTDNGMQIVQTSLQSLIIGMAKSSNIVSAAIA